eukprot:Skav231584  [mRNA]  locus=scaffold481:302600:303870:- [translate_table: standard]
MCVTVVALAFLSEIPASRSAGAIQDLEEQNVSVLGSKSKDPRFNSCNNPHLNIADVCNGRGSCLPFGDTGVSFCRCNPGFGGAECESKRRSQLTAWFLCLFLGPFGADQYYLGWYPEMLVTQMLSILGVALLMFIPNSRLPGRVCLVVLLGPWMRHVVIIGSAPAQGVTDRTSADLPRCAFVAFSMLWMAFIALAICSTRRRSSASIRTNCETTVLRKSSHEGS